MTDPTFSPEIAIALLASSPDAVIYAGREGQVLYWNPAAERIFGFTSAEAMGQSLDIIIPEKFRDAHWKGYDKALATGVTKYSGKPMTTRAQNKAGETVYVDLGFALVRDTAGEIVGVMSTARDMTERFNNDRETRREIRELREALKEAGVEAPSPSA